jgi:hypothetical protein
MSAKKGLELLKNIGVYLQHTEGFDRVINGVSQFVVRVEISD